LSAAPYALLAFIYVFILSTPFTDMPSEAVWTQRFPRPSMGEALCRAHPGPGFYQSRPAQLVTQRRDASHATVSMDIVIATIAALPTCDDKVQFPTDLGSAKKHRPSPDKIQIKAHY
jgi:hypothetical protein